MYGFAILQRMENIFFCIQATFSQLSENLLSLINYYLREERKKPIQKTKDFDTDIYTP